MHDVYTRRLYRCTNVKQVKKMLGVIESDTKQKIIRLLRYGAVNQKTVQYYLKINRSECYKHLNKLIAAGFVSAKKINGELIYKLNRKKLERLLIYTNALIELE